MQIYQIPRSLSPLNQWLDYIQHLHSQTIQLGLTRVKQVASNLELLTPAAIVFTVAGTNGKGTTCCALEAILLNTGLRIGVYSSPHLLRYTERIRIQGKEIMEAQLIHAFSAIEKGREETALTYFEFSTLAALHVFKQAQLDVVILEVGLGGRLDATNIIEPNVAIITNIALDHTDWLGKDLESIGREKAGIFRASKPAIIGDVNIPESIWQVAKTLDTQIYKMGVAWHYREQGKYWQWEKDETLLTDLPIPNIPLVNAATAIAGLSYSSLNISYQAIHNGLRQTMLPGRFQFVCQEPRLILDVAHNPHAARYLSICLSKVPRKGGKVRAVIAMMSDKDIPGTISHLCEQVDEWYCASLDNPRGATSALLSEYLKYSRQFIDVETAWKKAMQDAHKNDIVIVCGSFDTVSKVMVSLRAPHDLDNS